MNILFDPFTEDTTYALVQYVFPMDVVLSPKKVKGKAFIPLAPSCKKMKFQEPAAVLDNNLPEQEAIAENSGKKSY